MKFQKIDSGITSARGTCVRALLVSVSALASMTSVAQAQNVAVTQAAPQAAATGDDAIVVTGYRRSIEQSLIQKREAAAFVDVITAQDIGKFPDKNVADSLQRVPGIIIERSGGEGSRVSIRGLQSDLTLTQLNGNFIAAADSGEPSRSFNYVLLPSNMIGSVEVFKSPEARIDEGGVGGTVILRTRKPLDLKPWSGFVSAEGTYADTTRKFEPQVSGQVSWHNQDETFGILVSGTYQQRTNRAMETRMESWAWWTYDRATQPATDVNGKTYANDASISYWPENTGTTTQAGKRYSGYWAPQSVGATIRDEKRERLGIQATAQWKPVDDLVITANYFRFQLNSDYTSNALKIPEWGYRDFFTGATLDKSGTIFQGATFQVPTNAGCSLNNPPCTMETPQLSGDYSREKSVSNTFEGEAAWKRDRFEATFKAGKTRATGGPSVRFGVAAKPRFANGMTGINGNTYSAWDFSNGGNLNMDFSPNVQDNLMKGIAQIDVGSTGSGFDNSALQQVYAQADFTRHFDSFIDSIQFGGKYRDSKVKRERGKVEWYANAATKLRYQDTPAGSIALPSYFYDKPIGNIPGGFNVPYFPGINFKSYLDAINKAYGDPVRVNETDFAYNIGERIWSGYGQINFKTGGLRGNIGARFVHTKQYGETSDRLQYLNDYYQDGPQGPFGPPTPGPDGLGQVLPLSQRETIVNQRVSQNKSYNDFLPSFNISYDVTDTILLRGAVAKVVARPAYTNLGSQRSLTYRSPAYAADRTQYGERAGWTGSGGNADLKPFSAWQYDLGLEWYFKRGSVVGVSLFRKDVSNFIVPLILDLPQTVNGQNVLIQSYSTVANGSKARSQGVELYAQHTLSFGLGAQVNFTYNDTSVADIAFNGTKVGSSPLVGSSKTQVNGSIFWETDKFLVRASYNRRGNRVQGIASGLNIYDDPYEQVDLNASFNITEKLQLTASIINLTKSEERQHLGNDTKDRLYTNFYTGRRAYVGVNYNF